MDVKQDSSIGLKPCLCRCYGFDTCITHFPPFFMIFCNSNNLAFSGTIAFLRSISLEAVGLGVHLAAGAHDILLQAEYILTSIPPSVKVRHKTKPNVRSNQPKDAQEGLKKVNLLYFSACIIFQFLMYRKMTHHLFVNAEKR